MSSIATAKAAELLFWAREKGAKLPALPSDLAPSSLEQAQDIQDATARLRGGAIAGYKIGLTNDRAQSANGASEPIVGYLMSNDIRPSGSVIAVRRTHLRAVEAEVVFEIGSDLLASRAPFSDATILRRIRSVAAGIEICDSRFADSDNAPLPNVVADNSNADLLVVGDRFSLWDDHGLFHAYATLSRSSGVPVYGSTSVVLQHPLKSVTWLANWLARRGRGLQAGQLIATGSCTGVTEAGHDDVVTATFAGGARAVVRLADFDSAGEVTT